MKLTAEHYNRKVTVELSDDSDADEVLDACRTLAIGMTYHPNSFLEAAIRYVNDNTVGGIKNARVEENF